MSNCGISAMNPVVRTGADAPIVLNRRENKRRYQRLSQQTAFYLFINKTKEPHTHFVDVNFLPSDFNCIVNTCILRFRHILESTTVDWNKSKK